MRLDALAIGPGSASPAADEGDWKHALVEALWEGPTPLALFDDRLRFVRVNEALARLNGVPVAAHVGRTLGELLGLEGEDPRRAAVEQVEATIREVFESGSPRANVPILGAPEGDRARGWTCSYLPVAGADGRIRHVCSVITDLTAARVREEALGRERDRAEEAARRLARLQAITAALSRASTADEVAGVLVVDAKDALGVASCVVSVVEEAGELRLVAAVGAAARVRERVARLAPDAPLPVAVAARTGEAIWLETPDEVAAMFPQLSSRYGADAERSAIAALPLAIGDRVLGAVAFGFDAPRTFDAAERELLTAVAAQCAQALDRARLLDAERDARAGEERSRALLDAIFDNAPLGIGFVDRELRFVRVNPGLAGMNGIPAEAHVGRTPRELLPDMPHELVDAAFRDVLRTGLPKLDVELSGETPAAPGHLRHWSESWYPVRSGDATLGIGILVREVTREREAQEFQRNVLGIVGHDLRNPLSAITGSAQLLLRHAAGDPKARGLAERITANAARMQRIIAVLVDYARVRGGSGIPLRPQPCDLGAVCRAVVEECEAAHPGRSIAAAGPDLAGAWDPDRVGQVVANLVSNALDYSPRDSVVHLSWRAERGAAVVEVANEGAPIRPELLPSLFEPFRRGEHPDERRRDGLGLGLFIARSIATAHGGTIEARSAPGQRTTFTLRLPR